MRDRWAEVLFIASIVVLLPLALWLALASPCSMWRAMPMKDVPARCVGEFLRPDGGP